MYREGLLSDDEIQAVIDNILERGGRIKNLYGADGKKIAYYQVNATYFSALGEDEQKLLLARAIQLFTPGIPQVWYLDLFAGKNDYAAADRGAPLATRKSTAQHCRLADIDNGLKTNRRPRPAEAVEAAQYAPRVQRQTGDPTDANPTACT